MYPRSNQVLVAMPTISGGTALTLTHSPTFFLRLRYVMPSSTKPRANGCVAGGWAGSQSSPRGGFHRATEAMAMASPIPLNSPVVCSRMLCQLVS